MAPQLCTAGDLSGDRTSPIPIPGICIPMHETPGGKEEDFISFTMERALALCDPSGSPELAESTGRVKGCQDRELWMWGG